MKTNQIITRKIGDFNVYQRTDNGSFDANALLNEWNNSGNTKRRMDDFLNSSNTKEFINELISSESPMRNFAHGDYQVVTKIKGKNTKNGRSVDKVWMEKFLFLKFAMWLNPKFELKVLKFVYDEMIKYRNDAGDAYVKLAASISKIVNKDFMPRAMSKIGEALNYITFNEHEKNLRNKFGEESKLRELYMLENKVSELIDEGFITTYDNLIKYLRNLYFKRYTPEIFTTN